MPKPKDTSASIIRSFHPERMGPFLSAVGGNRKDALRLYRWHQELSSAVQVVLGLTEVVLRNAMDEQLQLWLEDQDGAPPSWLLHDPPAPLKSLSGAKRIEACKRAREAAEARTHGHPRYGVPVNHGDVLAQITFSMWKELLPYHGPEAGDNATNRGRALLWEEALHRAFPHVDDSTGELTYWRVAHLYELRNRVSHMESLLNVDVNDVISNDAFSLLRSINPHVEHWVSGANQVKNILRNRPEVG